MLNKKCTGQELESIKVNSNYSQESCVYIPGNIAVKEKTRYKTAAIVHEEKQGIHIAYTVNPLQLFQAFSCFLTIQTVVI